MRHTRPIVLGAWQQEIVDEHPGKLLSGLFHSDGCRVMNWATAPTGKRYEGYPRYVSSNTSSDVIAICRAALDQLGIACTGPEAIHVSVARRAAVALLDEHVGPES